MLPFCFSISNHSAAAGSVFLTFVPLTADTTVLIIPAATSECTTEAAGAESLCPPPKKSQRLYKKRCVCCSDSPVPQAAACSQHVAHDVTKF